MKQFIEFLIITFMIVGCADSSETTYSKIVDPILPQPTFPGGHVRLQNYLRRNYKWEQRQVTVEGLVVVQFTVLEDGSISDPKVLKSLCETCDKEAIRLVANMPKWEPVIKDGKPIRENMSVPIRFGLTNPYK